MPNWTMNDVTLTHRDPAMIERAYAAFEAGRLLQEFIPCPVELLNTVCGHVSEQAAQDALAARQAANSAKYGYSTWYDFNVANWGTKWDVGGFNASVEEISNGLVLSFESAWAPPVAAYSRLEELGFEVTAFYYEPGMVFVGKYADGCDDYYDYGDYDSDTVRDYIGDELDDHFCISEHMADMEDDMADLDNRQPVINE